jgi:hypothetical protein
LACWACRSLTRTPLAFISPAVSSLLCIQPRTRQSSQVSEDIKKGREELARNWKRKIIKRKKRLEAFHLLTHTECKLILDEENGEWLRVNWGNALDLYPGDTWFESWLGHWRSWLKFFLWLFAVPRGKCQGITSFRLQTLPSKLFPILQPSYHLTLYSLDIESVVKQQTKRDDYEWWIEWMWEQTVISCSDMLSIGCFSHKKKNCRNTCFWRNI